MAGKLGTTPPRGMRDLLPAEVDLRDAATQQIIAVYRAFGFRRIETPALESLRLLVGSEGGENEKLIFKILKRGEDLEAAQRAGGELAEHGLRFDLTVPLARYYAENHARLPDPLKAIQIGPVWRAERPQKGRYRQFTQCDIDILGVGSAVAEVELILATGEALTRLGLSDLTVRINDRRLLGAITRHCGFPEAAQGAFFIAFDKLDKIGAEGVLGELREAGHAAAAVERFEGLLAHPAEGRAVAGSPARAARRGRERCRPRLRVARLDHPNRGTARCRRAPRCAFDPTLVRGMGYYTGTDLRVRPRPPFPRRSPGAGATTS